MGILIGVVAFVYAVIPGGQESMDQYINEVRGIYVEVYDSDEKWKSVHDDATVD